MVVPWTAGGTADLMARIASQKFSESFGQQFVVDNRPGAGGLIGTEQVAKAAPDGLTLLLATTAPNSVAPSLYAKLPFDPVKDFASVSLMATTCYVLSVHPSMPVSNARQLVALAKARPGQLTFSSPGSGTPNHLSGEMLKMLTGIDMQHVPFKGSAQAISDVIGGQIAMSFENIVVASPYVKSGRIKALAVTSAKRASALPSVPTMAESGVPRLRGDRLVRGGGAGRNAERHRRQTEQRNGAHACSTGHQRAHFQPRRRSGEHDAGGDGSIQSRADCLVGQGGQGSGDG